MTKKEIAETLMKKEDLSKAQSERIVALVFDDIAKFLSDGHEVAIAGFGKFSVVDRPERDGMNPSTKEKIRIPASKSSKFKAAKQLRERLQ